MFINPLKICSFFAQILSSLWLICNYSNWAIVAVYKYKKKKKIFSFICIVCLHHRRRMVTETKAKVVVSVYVGGRIYSIPCCFVSVDLEEMVDFILFFQINWGKIASAAGNWINSAPKQTWQPLPLLLSPSFFYGASTLINIEVKKMEPW